MSRSFQELASSPGVFGDNQQFAENLVQLDTSSAVFATWFSLVTPAIAAGTYRVADVFQYTGSTGSTVGEYQLLVDGATVLDIETLNVASAGEKKTYSNLMQIVLAAGVHTFAVQARRSSGSGVLSVDDGKVELWRVA